MPKPQMRCWDIGEADSTETWWLKVRLLFRWRQQGNEHDKSIIRPPRVTGSLDCSVCHEAKDSLLLPRWDYKDRHCCFCARSSNSSIPLPLKTLKVSGIDIEARIDFWSVRYDIEYCTIPYVCRYAMMYRLCIDTPLIFFKIFQFNLISNNFLLILNYFILKLIFIYII